MVQLAQGPQATATCCGARRTRTPSINQLPGLLWGGTGGSEEGRVDLRSLRVHPRGWWLRGRPSSHSSCAGPHQVRSEKPPLAVTPLGEGTRSPLRSSQVPSTLTPLSSVSTALTSSLHIRCTPPRVQSWHFPFALCKSGTFQCLPVLALVPRYTFCPTIL